MARVIPGMFDKTQTSDPYNMQVAQDWIEKAIAGTLTGNQKISTVSLTEALDLTGNVVLGDASTDTLTVNAASTFAATIAQAVTTTVTTGASRIATLTQTHTGAGTGALYLEALKVEIISNVKTGGWANAIFGKINYDATGLVHGAAAVFSSEIAMPSTAGTVIRGSYYNYAAEINCPTGFDGAQPMGVMAINTWGGAEAQFDTYGYLFDIGGVTVGSGKFFSTATNATIDHALKCRIGGVVYWLGLYDALA